VADEPAGIDTGILGAAATELAEGGAAAAESDCGVACVDGNAGADRATSDESSGVVSFFHHAQRGPDWQPTMPTKIMTISAACLAREFMA
jgi:nicotinamide mononucleotide (NMN) deamidase PncC